MKELQIFDNAEFGKIRTLFEDGKVLFCGSDVAKALGYSNTSKAISDHCKGDITKRYPIVDALGRTQEAIFITEGDVYRLTFSSKLPNAEHFTDYVTEEVLPSIRKTGAYSAAALSPAEQLLAQAQLMVEQERRIKALEDGQEQMQNTVQKTMEVFAAPVVSPDDWTEAMNHQINTLVERYEANHQKYRSELYKELESTAGVDLAVRQTRLRNRMRKGGATASECKSVSKLQVVARDRKLRPIFEGIVRRRAAMLLSASAPEAGKAVR